MIALAAAFWLAQAAPPPAPTPEEVVVMAERMRRVKFTLHTDRKTGVSACRFKRRSFDPAFDAHFCAAAQECAAVNDRWAGMQACLKPKVEAYARALVARRSADGADCTGASLRAGGKKEATQVCRTAAEARP